MHAVVGDGDGLEVEVAHAVDLELEGERRLQVAVDPVLDELRHNNNDQQTMMATFASLKSRLRLAF